MAVVAQAINSNQNPSDLFEEYLGHPIEPMQKIVIDILARSSYRKLIGEVSEKEGYGGTIQARWRQKELEYKARQATKKR
ncbi:MAG: hypothetical protein V3W37_08105 [Candidatus Binatia bacterium]